MLELLKKYIFLINWVIIFTIITITTVGLFNRLYYMSIFIIVFWYIIIYTSLVLLLLFMMVSKSFLYIFNIIVLVVGTLFLILLSFYFFYNIVFLILLFGTSIIYRFRNMEYRKLLYGLYIVILASVIIAVSVSYNVKYYYTNLLIMSTNTVGFFSLYYFNRRKTENIFIKYLTVNKLRVIFILFLSFSFLATIPTQYIVVDPNGNKPSIVFWTGAKGLPDKQNRIDLCKENNIGFAVVLREKELENDTRELEEIGRMIDNDIDIYIATGGSDNYFLTIKSADQVYDNFILARNWMIDNGFYNDDNFKGFVFDAENDKRLMRETEGMSTIEKVSYLVGGVPEDEEVDEAEDILKEMVDLVQNDGKEIGIAKFPTFYDEMDGDNDIARLIWNIYNLDVDWDFTVSMCYRTLHIPTFSTMLLADMEDYNEISSTADIDYYEQDELEQSIVAINEFYYTVSYEVSGTDNNVNKNNRYIFIGTFWTKFRRTSYIEDKEYLRDLDICRSLGVKSVWLYYYGGFGALYGKTSGLEEIIEHLDQSEIWYLEVPLYYLNRDILLGFVVSLIDRILVI